MQVDILAVGISCAASILCAAYAIRMKHKADEWVSRTLEWHAKYQNLLGRAYLRDEKGRIAKARDVLK